MTPHARQSDKEQPSTLGQEDNEEDRHQILEPSDGTIRKSLGVAIQPCTSAQTPRAKSGVRADKRLVPGVGNQDGGHHKQDARFLAPDGNKREHRGHWRGQERNQGPGDTAISGKSSPGAAAVP